jgi:hypothetical protein
MDKLIPASHGKWPERLTMANEWRRLHEGGLDDICAWHTQTREKGGKPILVVIDVLAKVRKPSGKQQIYEADYEALSGLTKLANDLGIAVIVVHHTRKMAADDLMETVSGSFGVSGAVDTILVMANKSSGTVLDIRGRDVESAELAIEFSKQSCRWRVLGNAAEIHVSEQRASILGALKEAGEPMGVSALIEATGMKRNSLELLLSRMAKEGAIRRIAKGLYAHSDYTPPPSPRRSRSVSSVAVKTGTQTDIPALQPTEDNRTNGGSVLSVRSVRESTNDTGDGIQCRSDISSVLSQTDATDRQIAAQGLDKLPEFGAGHLSDDLSQAVEARQMGQKRPQQGNGHALVGRQISDYPNDRRGPEVETPAMRVFVREIRRPAISAGPDDDLNDFVM